MFLLIFGKLFVFFALTVIKLYYTAIQWEKSILLLYKFDNIRHFLCGAVPSSRKRHVFVQKKRSKSCVEVQYLLRRY